MEKIMDTRTEIALCTDALHAVALIRTTYASAGKSGELIRGIADALAAHHSKLGTYGGLCPQVSAAIYRGMLNREPPEQPKA